MREWYQTHLGIITNQYGAVFEWRQGDDSSKKGFQLESIYKETTKYFEPSTKDFMINYRVENLESLVEQLKKDGVTITDTIQAVEYGKFVHIMDIEGSKVELWEPNTDIMRTKNWVNNWEAKRQNNRCVVNAYNALKLAADYK